jgi:hypothetical protein
VQLHHQRIAALHHRRLARNRLAQFRHAQPRSITPPSPTITASANQNRRRHFCASLYGVHDPLLKNFSSSACA